MVVIVLKLHLLAMVLKQAWWKYHSRIPGLPMRFRVVCHKEPGNRPRQAVHIVKTNKKPKKKNSKEEGLGMTQGISPFGTLFWSCKWLHSWKSIPVHYTHTSLFSLLLFFFPLIAVCNPSCQNGGTVYHLVYADVLTSGMETIARIVRTCTPNLPFFSEVSTLSDILHVRWNPVQLPVGDHGTCSMPF